ncbi:UxaA family hydrolase [Haladaptatus caseinilyticus]
MHHQILTCLPVPTRDQVERTLSGIACDPNAGAVLVVSSGTEIYDCSNL